MKSESPKTSGVSFFTLLFFSALLTPTLYLSVFNLPFFFDDLDHFPYIVRTTLPEIWRSAGGFPYFRPLVATIWRVSYLILGENNPVVLHLLNLITHIINGALVALLARQYYKRPNHLPMDAVPEAAFMFVAIASFGFYPFSYQAVPWIGAYYHILVTTLVLVSLVSHNFYRTTNNKRWLLLGLTAATLAPFAHENGILIFPLIILITLLHPNPKSKIQNLKSTTIWLLPPLIWLPIWLAAPKARTNNFALNNLETIWQNTAYYLQGVAFPFSWLGGRLHHTHGWNDLWAAVITSLCTLFLAALILYYFHRTLSALLSTFLLPLAFFFVSATPAILLLSFAYNISAPRLQMLSSIGAALLWANVLTPVFEKFYLWGMNYPPLHSFWGELFLIMFMFPFFFNPAFMMVSHHMSQHDRLGTIWNKAADLTTTANDNGRPTIFINLPSSLTERTTTFPLGHEGTVFMVPYIPTQRIIEVNTGRSADFALLRYEDIRPEHDYIYDVLGDNKDWPQLLAEHPDMLVYNTKYWPSGAIFLQAVGGLKPAGDNQNWQVKPTAHELKLTQSSVKSNIENRTQTIEIQLDWHATEPLPWELTFFVHLIDESGNLIAQADGNGWANTLPLAQWPLNTTITDIRTVEIENYFDPPTIRIGLYNWMTGERIPLETADGTPVPDNAYTLP